MFSLNSVTKIFVIKRARTSSVRDQDATTAPARHVWETGSLNWAQFKLRWFIRFSEFTKSSAPFRRNSIKWHSIWLIDNYGFQYKSKIQMQKHILDLRWRKIPWLECFTTDIYCTNVQMTIMFFKKDHYIRLFLL